MEEGAMDYGTQRRRRWNGNSKGMDERGWGRGERKRGAGRVRGMMREKEGAAAGMGRVEVFRWWR